MLMVVPRTLIAGGPDLERQVFYAALRSEDTVRINEQLLRLERSSIKEKNAFLGALLMRKARFGKRDLETLSMFARGRKLLERTIKEDSTNTEYRFLRLMIQEHAPDFLNYHSRRKEDAAFIRKSFNKLRPELQSIVRDYSRNSGFLKPEDFAERGK